MKNKYESWIDSHYLKNRINNPNIEVGDYTYYSGYYHEKEFEDYSVRYLLGDKTTKNYKELFGEYYEFDKLKIGKFCSIASGAIFLMAGNQGHNHHWISAYPFHGKKEFSNSQDGFKKAGDTIIGNDVWIGTEAIIMPGVKIESGAVIGARALVTKNVPAYSIVGENPAKVICKRFSEDEIKMLLEIAWWDLSIEEINKMMKYICSDDIKGLHDAISNKNY